MQDKKRSVSMGRSMKNKETKINGISWLNIFHRKRNKEDNSCNCFDLEKGERNGRAYERKKPLKK